MGTAIAKHDRSSSLTLPSMALFCMFLGSPPDDHFSTHVVTLRRRVAQYRDECTLG
jgi:hypothetical protein